jgi:hypothetical protein
MNLSTNTTNTQTKPKCSHSDRETCINCIDKKKNNEDSIFKKQDSSSLVSPNGQKIDNKIIEEKKSMTDILLAKSGLTKNCLHGPGQKCLHCMQTVTKGPLIYNCQHGSNGKCPNCVNKGYIQSAKHKSFDQYLNENKEKCKGIHEKDAKCNNCLPPAEIVYKMKPDCPYHAPYPEGLCSKCMPPNAVLLRQVYRHVDYVSFMNMEELNEFVNIWQKGYCMKQRMGFLYGYYASDPNYPVLFQLTFRME